mgnify:CR=1 FL=1
MSETKPQPLVQPPGLVIFDCDGVLVDTEGLSNRILTRALQREGLDVDLQTVIRDNVGRSMASVRVWAEDLLGRALPPSFIDDVQAETFAAFRAGLEPIPGVAGAIDAVQAAGMPTCVASSGAVEKMQLTLGLTGLLDRFNGRLYSATMVKRGKPHPDIFLHAAAEMGCAPADAVVIEDSLPGVTGGVAAGMKVFAYAAPGCEDIGHGPEVLSAAGGIVFRDMAELPERLGLKELTLS